MRFVQFMRGARLAAVIVLAAISESFPIHTPLLLAPRGVVLITLDTTRVDRLSPYGFRDISLPHLERLAREGVVFDQATSVAPLTLPAHTSLLTGLLPPNHGVRDNADTPVDESLTTLVEVLRKAGFRTGAFVGSTVLDPDRGLGQGFERYDSVSGATNQTTDRRQRRADLVVKDALSWLDTVGESRFFLWAHLYDPHRPYDPPEPYATTYAHSLYLGEIAFADSQIGRILDALEDRKLLNRTVVVVAGDHGESLGERGERDHGVLVYENVLRVPLIVRAADVAPFRVGDVVRLTDVMPTLLDLLDVSGPQGDGVTLLDVMLQRRRGLDLEAYSETLYPARLGCSPLHALRDRRFKLIDGPRPELYDLERDPFEQVNIYDDRRPLAHAMRERIATITKRGAPGKERTSEVSTDLEARLAALGYVDARVTEVARGVPLPDTQGCTRGLATR